MFDAIYIQALVLIESIPVGPGRPTQAGINRIEIDRRSIDSIL